MKKRRFLWFVLISGVVVFVSGCWLDTPPGTQFSAALGECLVDLSDLPRGWLPSFGPGLISTPDKILPGRPKAQAAVGFSHSNSNAVVNHQILSYADAKQAERRYQQQSPFFSSGTLTPWTKPEELHNASLAADQFQLACAKIDGGSDQETIELCIAHARYGDVLSTFSTWVSPDYMTYADLEHILAAIDEHMASCAGMPVADLPATR